MDLQPENPATKADLAELETRVVERIAQSEFRTVEKLAGLERRTVGATIAVVGLGVAILKFT